jgi:hypothetical protein
MLRSGAQRRVSKHGRHTVAALVLRDAGVPRFLRMRAGIVRYL